MDIRTKILTWAKVNNVDISELNNCDISLKIGARDFAAIIENEKDFTIFEINENLELAGKNLKTYNSIKPLNRLLKEV